MGTEYLCARRVKHYIFSRVKGGFEAQTIADEARGRAKKCNLYRGRGYSYVQYKVIHANVKIPLQKHSIQLVEFILNHTLHNEAALLLSESTKREVILLFRFYFSKMPVFAARPQYL